MSLTQLIFRFQASGVPTDPDTVVLSDTGNTFGVKRQDNDAVVVANGTAMTKVETGVFEHTFTDPADSLTYDWVAETVFNGETKHYAFVAVGGVDTTNNLYQLLPQIQPYLRGLLTDPIAKQKLREAARDFMQVTGIWEEDLATITSVADTKIYTLSTTFDAIIRRVMKVELDGEEITFTEVSTDGLTLTLTSETSEAGKDIDVLAELWPKESLTQLPPRLIDRWGNGIAYGAIMLIKAPGSAWRDDSGFLYYQNKYLDEVGLARIETVDMRGPAARQRIAIPRFT